MSVNALANPTSCQTASDGSATITVSSGVAPFTYLWSNGSASEQLSGLTPGTCEVTVTDAVGCQATVTATVAASEQPCPKVKRLQIQSQCSDNTDELRWLIINPNATAIEVEYQIETTGQRTAISALPGEVNLVTSSALGDVLWIYWTDEKGEETGTKRKSSGKRCTCVTDFSLTVTNAACEESTGSIKIAGLQGSGRYQYVWSNGATSKNLNNVPPGLYTLTVTDRGTEEECNVTREATVGVTSPQITLTIEQPLSCDDATDGKIRTKVSGGKSPYTFSWEHGATTRNLSQLAAGEYTLTITDANGCQNSESITLAKPNKACISPLALSSLCSDDEAQLLWQISNPNEVPVSFRYEIVGDPEQTGTLVAAANTSTQLSTSDNKGANLLKITWEDEKQIERSLTQGSSRLRCSCNLAYRLETKAASCEEENGWVKLIITEGSGRYDFLWSTGATTRNIANLPAGTYSVTVTDKGTEEACVLTKEMVMESAAPMVSLSISSALSCDEAQDATVSSTVSGGQAPYSYQWSSGQTTSDISSLSVGSYTLTVNDAKGCEAVQSIEVVAPDVPCRVVSPLNLTSFCDDDLSRRRWRIKNSNDFAVDVTYEVVGASDQTATISAEASGDTYFFTQKISGANTVKIYWADEDGNTQSKVKAASNQQCNCQLTYALIAKDVACDDPNSGGAIQLTINGGSGSYQYQWSNGATTQNLEGVSAGTYSVTVTDRGAQANCVITKEVTITSAGPSVDLTLTNSLSCAEAADGQVSSTVSGGLAPYSYQWSNGQGTADIAALTAGEYTLTVTDAQGCETSQTIEITAPIEPCQAVLPLTVASACDDDPTLRQWTITNPNGFPVDVSYQLEGSTNQATTITVSASANASVSTPQTEGQSIFRISWQDEQDEVATAEAASTDLACTCTLAYTLAPGKIDCDTDQGVITLTVTSGSGNYSYAWSTGATTQNLTDVPAGTYSVTVTDAANPTLNQTASVTIRQDDAPAASVQVSNGTLCGGGSAILTAQGSSGQYLWYPGGQTTASIEVSQPGGYFVTVTNGSCAVTSQTVTIDYQPTSVRIVSSRNSICSGEQVTLTSSVTDGNVWSTGQTSRSIIVDAAGTYSLSIATDCGSLEASATIEVKAEEECRQVCDPVSFPVLPKDEPCDRFSADLVVANAQRKYEGYLRRKQQEFELGYRAHCLDVSENFTMEYEDKEHHRTLYYYDQGGNLVRTVPPEGVKLITDANQLARVKLDRAEGRKYVFTEHELATTYSYNSLNQLVTQDMPDHAQLELKATRDLSASIPAGLTITSTQFSDAQNGYLIASDGTQGYFYTTEDGGENWSSLSKLGLEDLQAVQLVSSTVAYAVGERGTLLKSTDGGESWVLKPIPTRNKLSHVLFLNETEGMVYEEDGTAWYTSDGVESGVWEREDNLKNVLTGTLTGVDGYDDYVLASSKTDQRGYMYLSTDLGETQMLPGRWIKRSSKTG